jgi:hypothetical protein
MSTVAAFFPGRGRSRAQPSHDIRQRLLDYARGLVGVPYEINLEGYPRQPGGRGLGKKYPDLDKGLDCSGYVLNVLQHLGVLTDLDPDLTNCDRIWSCCQPIDRAATLPGDLVFFRGTYAASGMSHIGIVTDTGGGTMISAREPKVEEEPVIDYWERHLAGFGRLRGFEATIDPRPLDDGEPIQTRYGAAPRDLSAAIRKYFPSDQWVNAAEIAHCESTWNRMNLADTRWIGPCGTQYTLPDGRGAKTEVSRGYFQINGCVHSQWNNEEIYDADRNVAAAWRLYQQGGWRHWLYSAQLLGLV